MARCCPCADGTACARTTDLLSASARASTHSTPVHSTPPTPLHSTPLPSLHFTSLRSTRRAPRCCEKRRLCLEVASYSLNPRGWTCTMRERALKRKRPEWIANQPHIIPNYSRSQTEVAAASPRTHALGRALPTRRAGRGRPAAVLRDESVKATPGCSCWCPAQRCGVVSFFALLIGWAGLFACLLA